MSKDNERTGLSGWHALTSVLLLCMAAPSQAQEPDQRLFPLCENGNLDACNEIGYHFDLAGQSDEAGQFYWLACDGGLPLACSNLGELIYDGRGIDRDYNLALGLFSEACADGVLDGCAGMCLASAQTNQLESDMRGTCQQALNQACDGGNPWMCDRTVPVATTSSAVPADTTDKQHSGCQGQNFARSVEIIDTAWLVGLEVGAYIARTEDFLGGLNRMLVLSNQLNGEAQRLPPACQSLIYAWSEQISQAFSSYQGGTDCMGGVCCDDSGCYGG